LLQRDFDPDHIQKIRVGVSLFFEQGCAMPTYEEAVKLAKKYAVSAHLAFTKEGAAEYWGMAKKYQGEAAKLGGGRKPDIGPLPELLESGTSAARRVAKR
jgi:hypothetical protein